MVPHDLTRWTKAICAVILSMSVSACQSSGIIVESVDNYGGNGDLTNSIANGDGFLRGMLPPDGSPWHRLAHLTDANVWDTDLFDREIDNRGRDDTYFDQPGAAISYFTGHGIGAHGCTTTSCSTTATCTTPGAGARLPGTCRFSPFDLPRCCYMVNRALVTRSPSNVGNGTLDYTDGFIRWGESRNAGEWAQAGTNGGTNLVVLDISHGVLPPYWRETLQRSFAGVHLIATLMTAGGDTANVSERGAKFASFWAQNEESSVAQSWLDTMAGLPSNLGGSCSNLGGGRGFNGCGCHIVVAMDNSADRTTRKMTETWSELRQDGRDGQGNNWTSARWLCNYKFPSTTKTAWELP
jgi:hypothetical protein